MKLVPRDRWADAGPGFNRAAAEVVYKAMAAMDPDAASVYGRILVGGAIQYDLIAHRDELAKAVSDQVAARTELLRTQFSREAVAKARRGEDNTAEIGILVQIEKAAGFNHFDPSEHARGDRGRFVQMHTRIDTDPSRDPDRLGYAERKGVPRPLDEDKKLKFTDPADLSHYQQAYGQIADMVSPFHDPDLNALLHLKVINGAGEREITVPVGADPVKAPTKVAERLNPGDRIQSAAVSVVPKANIAGAAFDALAAATNSRFAGQAVGQFTHGALNPERLHAYNEERAKKPSDAEQFSGTSRAFGRLAAGSQLLTQGLGPAAPQHLQYALAVANHVGRFGPEAQKVIGPWADRAAYRYRGTERAPDPKLMHSFDRLRTEPGFRERWHAARRDAEEKRNTGSRRALRNAAVNGIDADEGWYPGPVLEYFNGRLPNPDLNELQRRSGVIPPSEGIIIDRKGKVTTQSIGYADDWYLPFDLKNLSALNGGGEYIRTRTFGGPTTEDIYTGLITGARHMTVVSHNGAYTVDFDDALRGGRRFNDKAARMVARYGQLLDAVRSEQVSRGGISPSRLAELREKALLIDDDPSSTAFKQQFQRLQDEEKRNPTLSQEESDEAAGEWLATEAAKLFRRDASPMSAREYEGQIVRNRVRDLNLSDSGLASQEDIVQRVKAEIGGLNPTEKARKLAEWDGKTESFNRAMQTADRANQDRARALTLNGKGYYDALLALKEQFPYYIADVHYKPWKDAVGRATLAPPVRESVRDTGYVAPRFNRPEAAHAGYFNEAVGAPKVKASSIRFQNYRNTGGRLVPVPTGRSVDDGDAAADARAAVPVKGKGFAADAQRRADLDLLDDLLKQERFAPGAKLKASAHGRVVDLSNDSIATTVGFPEFPSEALKRVFTPGARPVLEAMPHSELHALVEEIVNLAYAGEGKLFSLDEGKVAAFRSKGQVPPAAPVPGSVRQMLAELKQNHVFEGMAYHLDRNPTADVIDRTYKAESGIRALVNIKALPETVDDPDFEAKIDPLVSTLEARAAERERTETRSGRVDPFEAARDTRAAEGLLRATQLRRNWLELERRKPPATPAAGPVIPTQTVHLAMDPEVLARMPMDDFNNLVSRLGLTGQQLPPGMTPPTKP